MRIVKKSISIEKEPILETVFKKLPIEAQKESRREKEFRKSFFMRRNPEESKKV